MPFPHYTQLDAMDCGPTSLRIIAQYYGKHYSLQSLREKCHISREGVSLLGISDAAEAIGFRSTGVKLSWEQLRDEQICRASSIGTSSISSWSIALQSDTGNGGCGSPTRRRGC